MNRYFVIIRGYSGPSLTRKIETNKSAAEVVKFYKTILKNVKTVEISNLQNNELTSFQELCQGMKG